MHISGRKHEAEAVVGVPERIKQRREPIVKGMGPGCDAGIGSAIEYMVSISPGN